MWRTSRGETALDPEERDVRPDGRDATVGQILVQRMKGQQAHLTIIVINTATQEQSMVSDSSENDTLQQIVATSTD